MRYVPLATVVAIAAASACAAKQPGSAGARFDILGGVMSIAPSVTASIEPNGQETLMGLTPSSPRKAIVALQDRGHRGVAVFRRTTIPCARDPLGAARRLGETWRESQGPFHLVPMSPPTYLYIPDQLVRRGDATLLGAIVTCAATGLVVANVLTENDPARWTQIMRDLAGSIHLYKTSRVAAHKTELHEQGQRIVVDVPEGYLDDREQGMDFALFHVDGPDGVALSIYVGSHDSPDAPAAAAAVALPGGVTAKRWEDATGLHLERWWAYPAASADCGGPPKEPIAASREHPLTDEEFAELVAYESDCIIVQGSASGPVSAESSLRRLLSYSIMPAPELTR